MSKRYKWQNHRRRKKIANILNDYFSQVFTKEDTDNMPHMFDLSILNNFSITEAEVLKGLGALKINKSPGRIRSSQ